MDAVGKSGLPEGFIEKTEYKDVADCMHKQRQSGTWCDQPLLRSVCSVVEKSLRIITVSHGSATLLKGDAASQWKMAIFGMSELRNP